MLLPTESGKVEASGVEMVPHELKQIAGHRLLEIELDDLAVTRHPQLVRIRIGDRLNVCPSPRHAVTAVFRNIIDAIVFQPEGPIASSGPRAMMSRDFRQRSNAWQRHAVAEG